MTSEYAKQYSKKQKKHFAFMLKIKREALNMSQYEIAEKLGYSIHIYRALERGSRFPCKEIIEEIVDFFNSTELIMLGDK